jgi:uncharacterized membrane protein YjfL (UPF0719 family)
MRKKFGIQEANTAFATFQVGILLSGAVILSSVMSAAVNAIQFLNQQDQFNMENVFISLCYVVMFIAIGVFFTLFIIGSGIFFFFQLTNINEWEEIKKDNIPTSLISAALILGLSLIMDEYIGHLCEALIPYPSVMMIR